MKRKTAKEILAESFRELAETRNVDRITAKDITENCGYSSATFYRQFKDKYDLIAWEYSRNLPGI
ncbi:MAG: TetR family transcriptional regulator, partial [Mogibacterium sp.]|nr:TetR family transcriptional regulator [Mogibacterium sp.]